MRQLVYAAFAAALMTAPLGAQSPQSGAASPAADAQAGTRTVIGCVSAGTDGRSFNFMESATAPQSSDAAAAATAPAPLSWTLVAGGDVDLTKYVGKKVEITGSSDRKGGMSAERSESTTRSPSSLTGPRFHVKSVKVLAETCS